MCCTWKCFAPNEEWNRRNKFNSNFQQAKPESAAAAKVDKSPKKVEKPVKEAPVAEPAKEANGAKKGRGRPAKAAVKPAPKKAAPKRAASAGTGKGKINASLEENKIVTLHFLQGRGRPPKAKKQESADESAEAEDSDS